MITRSLRVFDLNRKLVNMILKFGETNASIT